MDKMSQNTSADDFEVATSPKHIYPNKKELPSRTNVDSMMDSPDPTIFTQANAQKTATVSARHLPDLAKVRSWRQKNGTRRFEGALMELTAEDQVKVRRIDGKKVSIKAKSLCVADLEYVEDQTGVFFGDEFFKGDGFEEAPLTTKTVKSRAQKEDVSIDEALYHAVHAYSDVDDGFGKSELTKATTMSPDTKRKNVIASRAASFERPAEVEKVPFTRADPHTKRLYTVPQPLVSMSSKSHQVPVVDKQSEEEQLEIISKSIHEAADFSDTEEFPAFADAVSGIENTAPLQHQTTEPRPRLSSDEAEVIHPDMVQDYLRERNMTHSTSNIRNNPDTEPSDDDDWETVSAPLDHSLAGVLNSAGTAPNGDGGMGQKLGTIFGTKAAQVYKAAEPHLKGAVKGAVKTGKKVIEERVLNEENKAWVMSGLEKGMEMGRVAVVGTPLSQTQTGRRLLWGMEWTD